MFAPTLASGAGLDARAPLLDVVRQHGGHAELLADGTMVASFPGQLPTDQAQRAARCALALRGVVAGRPIAVVAAHSLVSSVVPLGDALERGAQMLHRGDGGGEGGGDGGSAEGAKASAGVLVDAVVEGLLGPRFECRPLTRERFELVASNPPYIATGDPHLPALKHEPIAALVSGADGLDDLRAIITGAPPHLRPGGWLLLEHGWDQAAAVRALLQAAGFADVQSRRDLAGIERCSGGRRA